jgi:hypothetical protein
MSVLAKKIALGIVGAVIILQAFRPARTNPPVDAKQELAATAKIDSNVESIIGRSCNDCHSNRTVWPWYTEVAPVSWFVASDVNGGRRHMNFSEWGTYPAYKQKDLLDKVCKEVTNHDMPLWQYLLIHRNASLSDSDRNAICGWTKEAGQSVALADGIPQH